jgi:hypothetical protein
MNIRNRSYSNEFEETCKYFLLLFLLKNTWDRRHDLRHRQKVHGYEKAFLRREGSSSGWLLLVSK